MEEDITQILKQMTPIDFAQIHQVRLIIFLLHL
jgi:hypothetical protein